MLNILLLILKIAGILILSVIGLILLLLFFIMFVPVRYSVSAKYYQKVPYARLKISWLLNLLKVQAVYNKEFKADVRLLGFRLYPKKGGSDTKSVDDREYKAENKKSELNNTKSIEAQSNKIEADKFKPNEAVLHDEKQQKEHKEHKKSFIRRAADANTFIYKSCN